MACARTLATDHHRAPAGNRVEARSPGTTARRTRLTSIRQGCRVPSARAHPLPRADPPRRGRRSGFAGTTRRPVARPNRVEEHAECHRAGRADRLRRRAPDVGVGPTARHQGRVPWAPHRRPRLAADSRASGRVPRQIRDQGRRIASPARPAHPACVASSKPVGTSRIAPVSTIPKRHTSSWGSGLACLGSGATSPPSRVPTP